MDETLIEFDSLESTNDYLKAHWDHLVPFVFVRAQEQTKGKGRGDRAWLSQKGENLTFSFLLKDPNLFEHLGILSLSCSVAVSRTLERFGVANVTIKWPNDVLVNGKKVCGILLEGSLPSYCVVGIGINVNQTSFDGDYRLPPTSIALEMGRKTDIGAFYGVLREELRSLIFGGLKPAESLEYYHSHDALSGKKAKTHIDGALEEVDVLGVDEEYRLLVKIEGKATTISSGELS